jgi:hypothetical protein
MAIKTGDLIVFIPDKSTEIVEDIKYYPNGTNYYHISNGSDWPSILFHQYWEKAPEPEKITILKNDASVIKPPINKTVIVHGGCAYWDGVNWRTSMDADNGIIMWRVEYWCDIPDL